MSPTLLTLLFLLAGLIGGFAIGWFLGSRKAAGATTDIRLEQELRARLDKAESEASQLRQTLATSQTSLATAEAHRDAAHKMLTEQRAMYEESQAQSRLAQEKSLQDLRDSFKALSADALRESAPEFLRLANESLAKFQESAKGELSHRQEAIAGLVKPLEEQLKNYQVRLSHSETTQTSALGELKMQLELLSQQSHLLSSETLQLRRVLSSNQARGRWGEQTLRRVIEAAGMSAHCDFCEQTQAGDGKPDLVVNLPGNRVIIVDSKVPDLDFLGTIDEANPQARATALLAHASKLKTTIKSLADRDYPGQFPHALDHVVLFLPAESLFSAALEGDQDLIIWATQRRILLATPASLIALLRSVAVSWQQHDQNENARAIAAAAQELFVRVCKFTEHFERIRGGIEKTTSAFNDAVGSYDRQVRPSGERVVKLGAGTTGKALDEIPTLDQPLRTL